MLDPKLIEAIEVCRPGSRDVEQPELAALAASLAGDPQVRAAYDTVQQLDRRMTSAMHEVSVPAGLANRILDRLAATPSGGDLPATPSGVGAAALAVKASNSAAPDMIASGQIVELKVPSSVEAPSGSRLTRRRSIAAGLGLAACLLLAVGFAVLGRSPVSPQLTVTEKALGWYEQLGDGWQPMAQAPKGFALPKGVGGRIRGWQRVANSVATSGVVYDLGQGLPGAGPRAGAVLFVIKATHADLPSSAPRTPQSTTAGFAVGVWQSGGLMYVLVVPGNEHDYQKLIRPVQPLA